MGLSPAPRAVGCCTGTPSLHAHCPRLLNGSSQICCKDQMMSPNQHLVCSKHSIRVAGIIISDSGLARGPHIQPEHLCHEVRNQGGRLHPATGPLHSRGGAGRQALVHHAPAPLHKGVGRLVVDGSQRADVADELIQQRGLDEVCLF